MTNAIITNPRGVRASWEEGLFDALCLSVHTLGGGEPLNTADRVTLVVRALKLWPDHAVQVMVDRVLMVEDTAAAGGRDTLIAMLAERDQDKLLVDALFRPILLASTLRQYDEAEVARLVDAIHAAGVEPHLFGLGQRS